MRKHFYIKSCCILIETKSLITRKRVITISSKAILIFLPSELPVPICQMMDICWITHGNLKFFISLDNNIQSPYLYLEEQ